jgi:flagellar basal body-associated protein FliL
LGGGYGVSLALAGKAEASEVDPEDVPAEEAAEEAPAGHGEVAEQPASAAGHGEMAGSSGARAAVSAGMTGDNVVTNLGTFTVNLRGSGGGRIVRLEVQLDSDAEAAADLGARTPQLRDSVITAVSDYTWAELEGVDGKTRLRDELLARVNGVAAPSEVHRLYFTQFVVQ